MDGLVSESAAALLMLSLARRFLQIIMATLVIGEAAVTCHGGADIPSGIAVWQYLESCLVLCCTLLHMLCLSRVSHHMQLKEQMQSNRWKVTEVQSSWTLGLKQVSLCGHVCSVCDRLAEEVDPYL